MVRRDADLPAICVTLLPATRRWIHRTRTDRRGPGTGWKSEARHSRTGPSARLIARWNQSDAATDQAIPVRVRRERWNAATDNAVEAAPAQLATPSGDETDRLRAILDSSLDPLIFWRQCAM